MIVQIQAFYGDCEILSGALDAEASTIYINC
jgi:hypothetical protein